jgi:hypothetical protein
MSEGAQTWFDSRVEAILERAAETEREGRAGEVRDTAIRAAVVSDGAAWMQRLTAALDDVTAVVNARVGRRIVATNRTPIGAVSLVAIASAGSAYLHIMPLLETPTDTDPGVVVFTSTERGRSERPFTFDLDEDGELRMRAGAELLTPEGFVRHIAESWLSTLSFSGV